MIKARTAKTHEGSQADETASSAENEPRSVEAVAHQDEVGETRETREITMANELTTVNETDDNDSNEADATEKTTFMLRPENKKFLYLRKVDGKGSLTQQVNELIEQARAVGW